MDENKCCRPCEVVPIEDIEGTCGSCEEGCSEPKVPETES